MNTNLIDYYRERAAEYEKIYAKPERQSDLSEATHILQKTFAGKHLFEIACGTGYWTERLAKTAASIFATDINDSVLEIARSKTYAPAAVTFETTDLFQIPISTPLYEALFGGFIWSHIPLQQLDDFIATNSRQVAPGGPLVFMDNKYVQGSNLPITHTDAEGNTFQTRQLDNGTTYAVLKNFPNADFIKEKLQQHATGIEVINLTYFWIAICKNR